MLGFPSARSSPNRAETRATRPPPPPASPANSRSLPAQFHPDSRCVSLRTVSASPKQPPVALRSLEAAPFPEHPSRTSGERGERSSRRLPAAPLPAPSAVRPSQLPGRLWQPPLPAPSCTHPKHRGVSDEREFEVQVGEARAVANLLRVSLRRHRPRRLLLATCRSPCQPASPEAASLAA